MTRTGGCLCGAIRYVIDGAPIATYLCHCTDCQRASGAPYVACTLVRADSLRIERGVSSRFEKPADSGNIVVREFCGECGSMLFSNSPSRPELRVVRSGTLDERSDVAPALHIWVDSALPWAIPDDGNPRFAQGPGSVSR